MVTDRCTHKRLIFHTCPEIVSSLSAEDDKMTAPLVRFVIIFCNLSALRERVNAGTVYISCWTVFEYLNRNPYLFEIAAEPPPTDR